MKQTGLVEEIDTGIWSIRVPMPDHPLTASFCYVFTDGGGEITVIDPGWPADESWSGLESALRSIGVAPDNTSSILLTHAHRDHSGLSGRLVAESGAIVALHRDDHEMLENTRDGHHPERVRQWLAMVGAPAETAGQTGVAGLELPRIPDPFTVGRWLEDGDVIPVPSGEIIAHWTPGHTPGHVCFEDPVRGLLFSGDHLLPRITPNISSMVGHRTSALQNYLDSLLTVAALPVSLVLPGHEHAFSNPRGRVNELLEHHRERLDEMLVLMARIAERSTFDIARNLTWSRPWERITGLQQRAALGEVLSHLYFLENAGAICVDQNTGPLTWSVRDPELLEVTWRHAGYTTAS